MKTCPICQATCFDDMDTCYGCLHRFNAANEAEGPTFHNEAADSTGERSTQHTDAHGIEQSSEGASEQAPLRAHQIPAQEEVNEAVMVVRIEIPASVILSAGAASATKADALLVTKEGGAIKGR